MIQSNAKFGLGDRLEVHLDHVRVLAGIGKRAEKTKRRSFDVIRAVKKSIVRIMVALNCLLLHILSLWLSVNSDPKHQSHKDGYVLKKLLEYLLKSSVFHLTNGGGLQEFRQFQDHHSNYKIVVFDGLNPDMFMFRGNSHSTKKLVLLYDRDIENYNVITNLMGAMEKEYICKGCDMLPEKRHKYDKVCFLCTATPPCTKGQGQVL